MASDCSSTISTEDEDTGPRSPSPAFPTPPPPPDPPALLEVKTAPSSTLSPATKSRLANLFKKIPKFSKSARTEDAAEDNKSSQNSTPTHSAKRTPRTLPPTPAAAPATPTRSTNGGLQRTRSMSSDGGGFSRGSERGSYRAPKGTSRYMQAAEAYKNRNSAGSGGGGGGSNTQTWSAASSRSSRTRPCITADTFAPRPIRTASASPAVHRKRMPSKDNSPTNPSGITSTHSTPSRKPIKRSQSRDYAEIETDEMILKRMEEILFTYKSKVEDRLAAEGKELPKDIFQDFTEHWINSSPHRAKSMDSLNSSEKSSERSKVPTLPKVRKDTREGYSTTKIPVPTFYKNSLS